MLSFCLKSDRCVPSCVWCLLCTQASLTRNPARRPSASDLLACEWIACGGGNLQPQPASPAGTSPIGAGTTASPRAIDSLRAPPARQLSDTSVVSSSPPMSPRTPTYTQHASLAMSPLPRHPAPQPVSIAANAGRKRPEHASTGGAASGSPTSVLLAALVDPGSRRGERYAAAALVDGGSGRGGTRHCLNRDGGECASSGPPGAAGTTPDEHAGSGHGGCAAAYLLARQYGFPENGSHESSSQRGGGGSHRARGVEWQEVYRPEALMNLASSSSNSLAGGGSSSALDRSGSSLGPQGSRGTARTDSGLGGGSPTAAAVQHIDGATSSLARALGLSSDSFGSNNGSGGAAGRAPQQMVVGGSGRGGGRAAVAMLAAAAAGSPRHSARLPPPYKGSHSSDHLQVYMQGPKSSRPDDLAPEGAPIPTEPSLDANGGLPATFTVRPAAGGFPLLIDAETAERRGTSLRGSRRGASSLLRGVQEVEERWSPPAARGAGSGWLGKRSNRVLPRCSKSANSISFCPSLGLDGDEQHHAPPASFAGGPSFTFSTTTSTPSPQQSTAAAGAAGGQQQQSQRLRLGAASFPSELARAAQSPSTSAIIGGSFSSTRSSAATSPSSRSPGGGGTPQERRRQRGGAEQKGFIARLGSAVAKMFAPGATSLPAAAA